MCVATGSNVYIFVQAPSPIAMSAEITDSEAEDMNVLAPKLSTTVLANEITDSECEDMNKSVRGHVSWHGETGSASSSKDTNKGKHHSENKSKKRGNNEGNNTNIMDDSKHGGTKVMEVFAGSGNLSRSFARHGMQVRKVDLSMGEEFDMSDMGKVEDIINSAIDCKYVHFAPPCNSFSIARYPKIRPASHSRQSQCCIYRTW
jgi:hypothetical protein